MEDVDLDDLPPRRKHRAWQPLLTPGWVLAIFVGAGVLFFVFGVIILHETAKVVQLTARYDNAIEYGTRGVVTIDIDKDMQPPIFLYYKLTNFYQNHRRYINSRSNPQLRGDLDGSTSTCTPEETFAAKTLYPCGLAASSYFNDTFQNPVVARPGSAPINVTWTDREISWYTDRKDKFKMPEDGIPATGYTRVGQGGFTLPLPTDEGFIVWMRTAGLPTFKKLAYRISTPLKRGDSLAIQVFNTFPVDTFDGTKSIVISTASVFGGKNELIGHAYLAFGALSLALAAFFLLKLKLTGTAGQISYFGVAQGRLSPTLGQAQIRLGT